MKFNIENTLNTYQENVYVLNNLDEIFKTHNWRLHDKIIMYVKRLLEKDDNKYLQNLLRLQLSSKPSAYYTMTRLIAGSTLLLGEGDDLDLYDSDCTIKHIITDVWKNCNHYQQYVSKSDMINAYKNLKYGISSACVFLSHSDSYEPKSINQLILETYRLNTILREYTIDYLDNEKFRSYLAGLDFIIEEDGICKAFEDLVLNKSVYDEIGVYDMENINNLEMQGYTYTDNHSNLEVFEIIYAYILNGITLYYMYNDTSNNPYEAELADLSHLLITYAAQVYEKDLIDGGKNW